MMTHEHSSAMKAGPSPQPGKKYFTVEEANRALPYVSRIVADVVAAYGRVVDLRHRLESSDAGAEREADTQADTEVRTDAVATQRDYDAQMERLSDLVEELQGAGVELKDFEKGLIDFPAVFEGREVLLCWHQGEQHVTHWHEVDAGFSGRQPVELLADTEAEGGS